MLMMSFYYPQKKTIEDVTLLLVSKSCIVNFNEPLLTSIDCRLIRRKTFRI
jgi:hypothetical protein